MSDRSKVRFQPKWDTGLRRAKKVEVCFLDASVHQTCLCKRTRDGVTPEEGPISLKKAKLESATC